MTVREVLQSHESAWPPPGIRFASTGAEFAVSKSPTEAERKRLCEALDFPWERLSAGAQVHGAVVSRVHGNLIGSGRDDEHPPIAGVDALITQEIDVPLMVLSADCAPVAICDTRRRAIGVIHAGWRGVVAGVINETIDAMVAAFGSYPSDCPAWIGPCARACCYEVGEDVADAVQRATGHAPTGPVSRRLRIRPKEGREREGALFVDLAAIVEVQLLAAGIQQDRIEAPRNCTVCFERFHSYRRQGSTAGRNTLIVALRDR